jgi:hypothetical protein
MKVLLVLVYSINSIQYQSGYPLEFSCHMYTYVSDVEFRSYVLYWVCVLPTQGGGGSFFCIWPHPWTKIHVKRVDFFLPSHVACIPGPALQYGGSLHKHSIAGQPISMISIELAAATLVMPPCSAAPRAAAGQTNNLTASAILAVSRHTGQDSRYFILLHVRVSFFV